MAAVHDMASSLLCHVCCLLSQHAFHCSQACSQAPGFVLGKQQHNLCTFSYCTTCSWQYPEQQLPFATSRTALYILSPFVSPPPPPAVIFPFLLHDSPACSFPPPPPLFHPMLLSYLLLPTAPLHRMNMAVNRYRPDLMSSTERADGSNPGVGPQLQPPLVLCSVTGSSRDTLIARLMRDYPSKFGVAVR